MASPALAPRAFRRPRALARTVLLAGTLVLAACSGSGTSGDALAALTAPEDHEGISGLVTARLADGRIQVEENPDEPSGSAKAVVGVTGARIYRRADGAQLASSALTVGSRVTVWFRGPVRESYPVQADAGVVALERAAP